MALVKGVNSNVTLEEADNYFETHVEGEAWLSMDEEKRNKCLITATSSLDELQWAGVAISGDQPLAFPRAVSYFDARLGRFVNFRGTPDRLLKATYEMALHLGTNDGILSDAGGVKTIEVGPIALRDIRTPSKVPSSVSRVIKPLLVNQGSSTWWRAN